MEDVGGALRRLGRRLQMVVGLGRVTAADDTGNVQMLQVQLGGSEVRDNTPRLGEFGFASMPPIDSDVIVLFLSGDRSSGVIINTGNQQYRLKNMKPGEAALYDQWGKFVHLTEEAITIEAGGKDVTVNNAKSLTVDGPTTLNGDVKVNGKIDVTGRATVGDGVDVSGDVQASGEGTFDGIAVSTHRHFFEAMAGTAVLTTEEPVP